MGYLYLSSSTFEVQLLLPVVDRVYCTEFFFFCLIVFRKRDKAHIEVKRMFYSVIEKRRQSGDVEDDMLQTLLESKYK